MVENKRKETHLKWSGSLHFRSSDLHEVGSSSRVGQSYSPSHCQDLGMQRPESHLFEFKTKKPKQVKINENASKSSQ